MKDRQFTIFLYAMVSFSLIGSLSVNATPLSLSTTPLKGKTTPIIAANCNVLRVEPKAEGTYGVAVQMQDYRFP